MGALRKWVLSRAWPSYDCENCMGMIEHGCYCDAVGAMAPGVGPDKWTKFFRWVSFTFGWSSYK